MNVIFAHVSKILSNEKCKFERCESEITLIQKSGLGKFVRSSELPTRFKYRLIDYEDNMTKNRLEAFSDGVLAIIITIMVLEMKVPHGSDFSSLKPLLPIFFSYVLSFVYLGIYWNNQHHMLQVTQKVNGRILWANLFLLFWLSLVPFVTEWMGENHFASLPVVLYGFILIMAGAAYNILSQLLVRHHGAESTLAKAVGQDTKGYLSLGIYAVAIVIAFFQPLLSCLLYAIVALMWIVPDSRIEKLLTP